MSIYERPVRTLAVQQERPLVAAVPVASSLAQKSMLHRVDSSSVSSLTS